ncbi:MAG TPA: hypothetical protein VN478_06070 [Clostridia bacterium]|nr:hypothetical protein [Clostridia bacterium]
MDDPEVETVLLACQAVERQGTFKSLERTLMITRSFVVLAPFDQAKVRTLRESRAAEAKAQGASRFQQLWYAAQAPFALVDGYLGMTLASVLTELPTARVLGYADIEEVDLIQGAPPGRFGARTAGEAPHKLALTTAAGEIALLVDGHTDPRELRRLLGGVAGDRLVADQRG